MRMFHAVASETARFALPEPKVGLFAGAGGVLRLPRVIGKLTSNPRHDVINMKTSDATLAFAGMKRAMGMMLTGRHVPAAEGEQVNFMYK